MSAAAAPRVGVGVLAVKHSPSSSSTSSSSTSSVLVSLRKSRHGRGEWALPGGHLELGESIVECARRELEEETGVRVGEGKGEEKGKLVATENCVFRSDGGSDAGGAWSEAAAGPSGGGSASIRAHYITLFVRFDEPSEGCWPEPEDREPEKHSPFEFVEWGELRKAAASSPSSPSKYAPLFGPLRMLVEKHESLDQLK